jgi:hypothetical protein
MIHIGSKVRTNTNGLCLEGIVLAKRIVTVPVFGFREVLFRVKDTDGVCHWINGRYLQELGVLNG